MPYIHSISTANPSFKISQNVIAEFMEQAMGLSDESARKLKAVFKLSGIKQRYSVLQDYQYSDPEKWSFYPKNDNQAYPGTEKRMAIFQKEAIPLAHDCLAPIFKDNEPESFTHLITVSCTGMYAPGLDIQLQKQLGLTPDIERTGIHFMGCFAAINALKSAYHICRSQPEAKVLILCLELCTLHFQEKFDEDNLLANTLFADGAAATIVSNEQSKGALELVGFRSIIDDDSEKDMAWHIGNQGFEMRLTSEVPNIIESKAKSLMHALLQRYGINTNAIKHYAIHPGGKRILQAIEKSLQLPEEANRSAYQVLRDYGNMSSPTILFVLNAMRQQIKADEYCMGFAFGPGLTMESFLVKGT